MKLLVQSDDYGITEAVSFGIIKGIKDGIIRNTGFFSNMPWAEYCAELIRPYLNDIAFGIDLNASTGPALLSKEEIPSLVQDDGYFLTSSMNRALDTAENDYDHVVYEDLYKEFEAQILKFIEIVGKKPDYLQGHAYMTKTTAKVHADLAQKHGILLGSSRIAEKGYHNLGMPWLQNPPTLDNQRTSDLEGHILGNSVEILSHEKAFLITHSGYVDAELLELSSFNIYRAMDLKGLTSEKVKQWVKDNDIELVTYKDI